MLRHRRRPGSVAAGRPSGSRSTRNRPHPSRPHVSLRRAHADLQGGGQQGCCSPEASGMNSRRPESPDSSSGGPQRSSLTVLKAARRARSNDGYVIWPAFRDTSTPSFLTVEASRPYIGAAHRDRLRVRPFEAGATVEANHLGQGANSCGPARSGSPTDELLRDSCPQGRPQACRGW